MEVEVIVITLIMFVIGRYKTNFRVGLGDIETLSMLILRFKQDGPQNDDSIMNPHPIQEGILSYEVSEGKEASGNEGGNLKFSWL